MSVLSGTFSPPPKSSGSTVDVGVGVVGVSTGLIHEVHAKTQNSIKITGSSTAFFTVYHLLSFVYEIAEEMRK